MALGKKDHRGFVKGLGGCEIGVGYKQAFGPVYRKAKKTTHSGSSPDELEEMKAGLTLEFEATLEEKVQERVQEVFDSFLHGRASGIEEHMTSSKKSKQRSSGGSTKLVNSSKKKPRLVEEYRVRDASYNDEEINEVREQWAKFFRTTYLLKD
ncbi:hypothetical protein SOVF_150920 [Spinacia oleracea]|nr:hypothetical protein SOVF_150920 [Spinacia oleracea]